MLDHAQQLADLAAAEGQLVEIGQPPIYAIGEQRLQDHPGALVRTTAVSAGSRVTVVGRLAEETLILITTWRH